MGLDSFIPGGAWLFPIVMILVMGMLCFAIFGISKSTTQSGDSTEEPEIN
jgi:hypothetical protein